MIKKIINNRIVFPAIFISTLFVFVVSFFPYISDALTIKSSGNVTGDTLKSGLVGWWTFDGKDVVNGRANDVSGNGKNGNFVDIATSTFYKPGKLGQAINNSDSISTQSGMKISSFTGIETYSYSLFINIQRIGSDGIGEIIYQETDFGNACHALYLSGVNINFTSVGTNPTLSKAYSNDRWYHVVVTNDPVSDISNMYVDGVLVSNSTKMICSQSYTNTAYVGYQSGVLNRNLVGKIDDLRVYNRALSATEVSKLYAMGAGGKASVTSRESGTAVPVGWWTFDGKDVVNGVARDMSGNGNHGNLTNISTSTFYARGILGQGFNFDGTNDYVNISDSSTLDMSSTTDFTVSFWMYQPAFNASRRLLDKSSTVNNQGYIVGTASNNLIYTAFDDGPTNSIDLVGGSPTPGKWNMITTVWDDDSNTNTAIYLNGVVSQTATGDGSNVNVMGDMSNSFALKIGSTNSPGAYFNGTIDDVRIHKRALTANEIKQLYNEGAGSKQNSTPDDLLRSGLQGHWTFDGKNVVNGVPRDISGNNRHGRLVSIATSTFYTRGKTGQAFNFDGTNDYVLVSTPASSFMTGTVGTISTWVKFDTRGTGTSCLNGNMPAIVTDGENVSGGYFWLGQDSNGMCVGAYDGSNKYVNYNTYSIDTWYHAVWLHRDGNVYLYLNGVSVASVAVGTIPTLTNNITFGKPYNSGGYFNGSIDDVRMYNRALTDAEILMLYNMGR